MRKRKIQRFIVKNIIKKRYIGTLALILVFFIGYVTSFAAHISTDTKEYKKERQYLYLSLPSDIPTPIQTPDTKPIFAEMTVTKTQEPSFSSEFDIDKELFVTGYDTVTLFDKKTKASMSLPLEDYVIGCVLAEMPGSYKPAALMAQAVACRTYAIYKMRSGTSHSDGSDLCTDPGHCQAFSQKSEVSEERYEKVKKAVNATDSIIMFHNSEPILAVFHSSSGKRTASSKEIWGGDREYLTSVETGEVYNSEMSVFKDYYFTKEAFASKLISIVPQLSGYHPDEILSSIGIQRSTSGRAESVTVLGHTISSSKFVSSFSLRTSDFIVYHDSEGVCITCYGYGHGVGLSQHGAEDMAQKGKTASEILTHYYTGISFGKVK